MEFHKKDSSLYPLIPHTSKVPRKFMGNVLPTTCALKIPKDSNNFTVLHEHEFQLVRVKVDDLRPFRYIVCKLAVERKLQNNFNAEEIYENRKQTILEQLFIPNAYTEKCIEPLMKQYERKSKTADNIINID